MITARWILIVWFLSHSRIYATIYMSVDIKKCMNETEKYIKMLTSDDIQATNTCCRWRLTWLHYYTDIMAPSHEVNIFRSIPRHTHCGRPSSLSLPVVGGIKLIPECKFVLYIPYIIDISWFSYTNPTCQPLRPVRSDWLIIWWQASARSILHFRTVSRRLLSNQKSYRSIALIHQRLDGDLAYKYHKKATI